MPSARGDGLKVQIGHTGMNLMGMDLIVTAEPRASVIESSSLILM